MYTHVYTYMATKTISITRAAYDRLRARKGPEDSFSDVVLREPAKGGLVHATGLGPERQDQHHVREIYRLPPRGGTDLAEESVDQKDTAITHEQVGRLDVPVRDTCIPE